MTLDPALRDTVVEGSGTTRSLRPSTPASSSFTCTRPGQMTLQVR